MWPKLVQDCQDRYDNYLIYAMEDADLSTFALMYPPWRTEEFEHLQTFLHSSVPGGRAGDLELSWDEIAERMNAANIAVNNFTGVTGIGYFKRTYTKRNVILAWKVRIRPQY